MSKSLSPAAQAALDAMYEINLDIEEENAKLAAAALRAVANNWCDEIASLSVTERTQAINDCSDCLREIAAELEGFNG